MVLSRKSLRAGMLGIAAAGIGLLALPATPAHAQLSQGLLQVNIDTNTGAEDAVYNGSAYYSPGAPVGNFGFQNGSDTATFALNALFGSAGTPVTVTNNVTNVTVTGTYTGGGSNIAFTRVYSIVSGLDVVQISTTFTNNGGAPLSLVYFDTLDPDQGPGSATTNDVFTLSGVLVGQSSAPNGTVVMGSPSNLPAIGYGSGTSPFGLGISDGNSLNTFLGAPFDPNGVLDDIGIALAINPTIGAGSTFNYTYYQAYGLNNSAAQTAFTSAAGAPAAAPEPGTLALLGVGGLAFAGAVIRRKKAGK